MSEYSAHASYIAAETWNRLRACTVGRARSLRIALQQHLVPLARHGRIARVRRLSTGGVLSPPPPLQPTTDSREHGEDRADADARASRGFR